MVQNKTRKHPELRTGIKRVVHYCEQCGSLCNIKIKTKYSPTSGLRIYHYYATCPARSFWSELFGWIYHTNNEHVDTSEEGSLYNEPEM